MDNLFQNDNPNTDSDYSSSEEDPEDINFNNIDYTNQYFLNNSSQQDYVNKRNELFTKDIIKQRILVDTHNIKKNHENDHIQTNNYTYYLNDNGKENTSDNYNETSGYDRYKNVIGFRFIKAIIPNRSYTINNSNNTFIIQLGNDEGDAAGGDPGSKIKITLNNGFYTTNIFKEASDKENGAIYKWEQHSGNSINSVLGETDYNKYKLNIEYDVSTQLFTFSMEANVNYKFKFVWEDDNKYEGARNLLGFTGVNSSDYSNSITAEQPPDMSVHYFDIVIPEIPYIACKHNTDRRNIIERVPIISLHNRILVYEDSTFEREDQNFFFPISLNKLTIQLYQKNGEFFDNNNRHHSLEFEITMINKVDIIK